MWAECQFVDPIADIAVLGSVDGQELYDEAAAYDDLTDEIDPLPIADAPEKGSAWLLSLGGQWLQCETWRSFGPFSIKNAAAPIRGGMSGCRAPTRQPPTPLRGCLSDIADWWARGGQFPILCYRGARKSAKDGWPSG